MSSLHQLREWFSEYKAIDLNNRYDYLDSPPTAWTVLESDAIDTAYIDQQLTNVAPLITVQNGFCNECTYLFERWPEAENGPETHTIGRYCHTTTVKAASRQGCRFCSFLLTRLEETGMLDYVRKIERRFSRLDDPGTASISILGGWERQYQLLWWNPPGLISKNCNSWLAQRAQFESNVIPPSYLTEQFADPLEVAQDWLCECLDKHPCSERDDLQWPSRLLYIGNDTMKLVQTTAYESRPQYATLSYCWGTDDFMKLLPSNIEAFLDSVPTEHLPSIFRDAIWVARRLGLQHIWIDALCIVQSLQDNNDWQKESGSMRSIYGGSRINIAASSAKNVHESLFTKPVGHNHGVVARTISNSGELLRDFHTRDVYEQSTTESHLSTRAWTLQERLLAPRTLYIGDTGMFWECRSTIASEFLSGGFSGTLGSQLVIPRNQAWRWSDIVHQYSKAELSNPGDKLSALSGIARRQQEITADKYLAGMWRGKLVKQLGWMCIDKLRPRPAWRAPTWSWMSIDGQVTYWPYWDHIDLGKIEYSEILDVSTSIGGPDLFGSITSAHLQLACTALVPGQCRSMSRSRDAKVSVAGLDDDLDAEMDTSDEPDPLHHTEPVYLLPLFGGRSGGMRRVEAPDDNGAGGDSSDEEQWAKQQVIRGMILRNVGDAQHQFERIGAFDIRSFRSRVDLDKGSPDSPTYLQFMQVMAEVGVSTAVAMCNEVRDTATPDQPKYVIDIV